MSMLGNKVQLKKLVSKSRKLSDVDIHVLPKMASYDDRVEL